jgi:hypothetical protein
MIAVEDLFAHGLGTPPESERAEILDCAVLER